jgi:hypothetical protein
MLSVVQRLLTFSEQQPSLVSHCTVHPFMIDLAAIDLQPGPDPSVAISGSIFDNVGNGILQVSIIGLGW